MTAKTAPAETSANTASRDTRSRLAAFAFCIADLLFEVDDTLTIRFAAGAVEALLGQSAEDLKGQPLDTLLGGGTSPWRDSLHKRLREPGRQELGTLPIVAHDGGAVAMAVSAITLDDSDPVTRIAMKRLPPAEAAPEADAPEAERIERFATDAVRHMSANPDSGLAIVSLSGEVMREACGRDEESTSLCRDIRGHLNRRTGGGNGRGGSGTVTLAPGVFSFLHDSEAEYHAITEEVGAYLRAHDPEHGAEGLQAGRLDRSTLDAGGGGGGLLGGMSEGDLAHGLISTLNKVRRRDSDTLSLGALLGNLGDLVKRTASEITSYRRSVRDGNFEVVFHPIVNIQSGRIHHYEALCRFDRTALSASPYERIVFAEEAGLIHELDLAMVEKVAEWLGRMPINASRYKVAVNLSGLSLTSPRCVQGIRDILKARPQIAGRLLFEVTESAKMDNLDAANAVVQELRRWQCPVCLDDFGAGAASFQYLSTLSVDYVKLDGGATQRALRSETGRAFLSALTELCRRLGTHTIAEMIDSPEMLRMARACRVDFVQGFLFGRPAHEVSTFSPLPNHHLFTVGNPGR